MMLGKEPGEDGLSGRIVNISSLGAIQIWKDRIPYNVSKAGVVQLTQPKRPESSDVSIYSSTMRGSTLPQFRLPI